MKYSLIIFDCDGVLVDSENVIPHVETRLINETGLSITFDELRALLKGKQVKDIKPIMLERGVNVPDEWLYDLAMATAFSLHTDLKAISGVNEVLELLYNMNMPICVASQSPYWRLRLSLSLTNLDKFFEGNFFCSSMVSRGKPAPDLFLYAADNFHVDPKDCLVIEDTPTGARAAKAAGMEVFGYAAEHSAEELESAGAKVFTNMLELPNLIGLDL